MRPRFRMGHLTREAAVVPREAGHLPRESAKQAVSANLGVPGAGGCLPGAHRRRAAAADVAARRHEMERASSAGRDKGVHGRHCLAGSRPQRDISVHARHCFTAASAPPPLRRRSFRRLGPAARHRRHAPDATPPRPRRHVPSLAVPRRRRGFALPAPPFDNHPARTRKYDLHTLERVG